MKYTKQMKLKLCKAYRESNKNHEDFCQEYKIDSSDLSCWLLAYKTNKTNFGFIAIGEGSDSGVEVELLLGANIKAKLNGSSSAISDLLVGLSSCR